MNGLIRHRRLKPEIAYWGTFPRKSMVKRFCLIGQASRCFAPNSINMIQALNLKAILHRCKARVSSLKFRDAIKIQRYLTTKLCRAKAERKSISGLRELQWMCGKNRRSSTPTTMMADQRFTCKTCWHLLTLTPALLLNFSFRSNNTP